MGQRTSYPPGTFSWVDLATVDVAAVKSFYSSLFGWTIEGRDGEGHGSAVCRLESEVVCGMTQTPDSVRSPGATAWTSFVTVTDVDDAVTRATDDGGEVRLASFAVLEAGRMAVLEDPQGAEIAVWQPGARIGADRVNDVGCLCMNELATSDIERAIDFYERLFGWTTEALDTGPAGPPMVLVHNDGRLNASITLAQVGESPNWRPYFTVDSTADAVRTVGSLGGAIVLEPVPIPDGSIAIVRDPQGALFGLFEGEVDP